MEDHLVSYKFIEKSGQLMMNTPNQDQFNLLKQLTLKEEQLCINPVSA